MLQTNQPITMKRVLDFGSYKESQCRRMGPPIIVVAVVVVVAEMVLVVEVVVVVIVEVVVLVVVITRSLELALHHYGRLCDIIHYIM